MLKQNVKSYSRIRVNSLFVHKKKLPKVGQIDVIEEYLAIQSLSINQPTNLSYTWLDMLAWLKNIMPYILPSINQPTNLSYTFVGHVGLVEEYQDIFYIN